MSIFICDKCGREFKSKQALGGHKSSAHKNGPRYSVKRNIVKKESDKTYYCKFCGRETTNPGANAKHEISCKQNPLPRRCGGFEKDSRKGKGTNQFKKARDCGLPVPKSKCKGRPRKGDYKPHSEETKKKLSQHAIKNGLGGVTQSRWIEYKGKTLGSSYELQVAKSLDDNNIKWDTCKRIQYIDPNGKKRTYTPDIYLIDYDVYLDPKNDFLIENVNPRLGFSDKEKISLVERQNDIRVLILNKHQLDWNTIKELL